MAHEITSTDNVVLARKPAWHGLGTVTEEAPTIAGALQLAGLDWNVDAWPISATDGERRIAIGTHVCNVRSDTREPLGIVGTGYVPLQNHELAGFAEQLMGAGARIESAGSIRGGKRVWFLARTEEVVELGANGDDQVVPYVLLANGHDGTLAFCVQPTSVRVVCSNTFHLALGRSKEDAAAGRALRIRHTSGMSWRLDDARRVLEAHGVIVASFRKQAQSLTAKHLNRGEVRAYFDSVYAKAFTEPTSDRGRTRRDNVLRDWWGSMDSTRNSLDGIRGTPWAAFNAVTDWADHSFGGDKLDRDERLFRSWFGSGAELKSAAWSEALQLA